MLCALKSNEITVEFNKFYLFAFIVKKKITSIEIKRSKYCLRMLSDAVFKVYQHRLFLKIFSYLKAL